MNVLYEEDGTLKVGAVLADQTTSLQVEAPHGKRSKIKAANVLLRFDAPALADFLPAAQTVADAIDLDFLWECCGADEFGYEGLAQDYFGRAPGSAEAAGVLLKLHSAPMYFYKKGRGRYRAAPADALRAALASVERKRLQALQRDAYIAELKSGVLPAAFADHLPALLYRPDRNSLEWKAVEEASAALKLTPVRLLERCGAISSPHEYHLGRFTAEHFPRGLEPPAFSGYEAGSELPVADVAAFSIDDASTTEIDDAFSLTRLPGGNWRAGIHIAAPALGIPPGSPADEHVRERLSTVYYPGGKITMLPDAAVAYYTLAEARTCPALSLYVELTPDLEIVASETRAERVQIAANLRHDTLEPVFHPDALSGAIDHAHGDELKTLWQWARRLGEIRRGGAPEQEQRAEYNFHVVGERVSITRRVRGSPIDQLVSELMICVNSQWGRLLADRGYAGVYRVQTAGKVRMTTAPGPHEGLGVSHYAWSSSPLRRYVDLINQRQLVAAVKGEVAPYQANDAMLLAAMRDFETTYDAYAEFQRGMERYWCLRWLLQEQVQTVAGTVIRENLVRLDDLPLVLRVSSLPAVAPGTTVDLAVESVDLLELGLECSYRAPRHE